MEIVAAYIVICIAPVGVWLAAMFGSTGRFRGKKTAIADATLQFLIVPYLLFALFFARSSLPELLFGALVWPLFAPGALLWAYGTYFAFLGVPLFVAALAAIAVGFLHHRFLVQGRDFWPTTVVIVGLISLVVTGELQFHSKLERAAASLAPECVTSDSFLRSMRRAGGALNSNLHAEAIKGADLYAWSFRTNDFYKVPESAKGNVRTHPGSWFSLPYPLCP